MSYLSDGLRMDARNLEDVDAGDIRASVVAARFQAAADRLDLLEAVAREANEVMPLIKSMGLHPGPLLDALAALKS